MDPLVQVAIITAVPATLAAIVGGLTLYVSYVNGKKLAESNARQAENNEKLSEVSKNVDGKLEDLKNALGRAERSEGREEGQDKERAAQLAAAPPREGPDPVPPNGDTANVSPPSAPSVLNLTVQPSAPTDLDIDGKAKEPKK